MQRALSRLPSWALDHREEDLRGWPVRDVDGRPLGRVTELVVDTDTHHVSELILDDGKHLAAHETLIGNHELRYSGNGVRKAAKPLVAAAPVAKAVAAPAPAPAPVRAAAPPPAPVRAVRQDMAVSDIADLVVPLVDEFVEVGKRRVPTGGLHVESRIVEKPFDQDVGLREEHIRVQRRPSNQTLSFADAETRFKEGTVEMLAMSEYPVVDKRARVVEDIAVNRAASDRAVHMRDTVRHTEASVQEIPVGTRPTMAERQAQPRGEARTITGDATTIPVVREEMTVGKKQYDTGGVRVTTRVTARPVDETITCREEKINVQRRTVDRPIVADDEAYRDRVFDLDASVEEPYLTKTARVVEEIRIHKDITERVEHIHDTLRNTDVSITERPASRFDSSFYADHYRQFYGRENIPMETVAPAYRFGEEIRRRSAETDWVVIETRAKPLWEQKNPGTWERYKHAIRAGWERLERRVTNK
ncbi:MAG: PRC and DUF2382 domain-containing protein [Polyangiaceae bacterium]|nr:PRC and DUF2382 domain-containing protein [Polyangiaceae bacterium]